MAPNYKTRSAHAGQDNGRPEPSCGCTDVSPRASQNVPTRKPTLIMQHLVGCCVLSVGRLGLGTQWPAPCYLDQLRTRSGTDYRILLEPYILSVPRAVHANTRPAGGAHYPWRCEAAVIPRPPGTGASPLGSRHVPPRARRPRMSECQQRVSIREISEPQARRRTFPFIF